MDLKTFFDNFQIVANAPGGIASLRELILDLAVGGKFRTEGGDSDRSPILVNHEALKIDSEKLWTLPAALPEPAPGWSRIPMARLGQWGSGGTPTASRKDYYQNGTIPWAVIGDLNNSVMRRTESLITRKALEASSTKMIPVGAVLVAMYGASIGKSAINGIECCTNQAIAHCVVDEDVVSSEYMFMVIKSLKAHLIMMGRGAAQPNISQSVLKHLVIDIPPKKIQREVIKQADKLLRLCDELDSAQNLRNSVCTTARKSAIESISTAATPAELNAAWKRISDNWLTIADSLESISSLRSLILGLAVCGSLIDKDAMGLSASEVTKSMRQKRQVDIQLMKRGERKKETPVKNQSQLFPSHWEKGLLGETCLIVMGNSPPGDSYSEIETGVPLINGPVEFSPSPLGMTKRTKFTTKPTYMCQKGDILVCVRGATTGRTNIAGFDACIGRGVALIRGYESQTFINLFMWNIGSVLLAAGKGTIFPSVSYEDLANLEIAIPPLDEQMRIATKIEGLMALCDELENSLLLRNDLAKKIAGSLASEIAA